MRTLVQQYGFIQTILKAEVNVGMRNIDLRNSPSEWVYIEMVFLLALYVHIAWAYEGHSAFQYGG